MFKQIKQPMGYEPSAITPGSYYSQVSNRRAGWNKRKGWNIRDGWYWPICYVGKLINEQG
jgi:hypothetical protein